MIALGGFAHGSESTHWVQAHKTRNSDVKRLLEKDLHGYHQEGDQEQGNEASNFDSRRLFWLMCLSAI